jgi:hypothetical protein
MNKKLLLKKLEELFTMKEVKSGFKLREDCLDWINKVAPLLKFNEQYYLNFLEYSHRLNLRLSGSGLADAFRICKSQIQMAIEELKVLIEMEEEIPEQMYFSENSQLDIQKNVSKVIRQAQKSLWVVDPYMNEYIIEELSEILATEFKLLTKEIKGLFTQRLNAFKQQFPNKIIEIKKSNKCHDRFYIIDQDQVWTLGASYKDAGLRATCLSKVKTDFEKQKIIDDFIKWWE